MVLLSGYVGYWFLRRPDAVAWTILEGMVAAVIMVGLLVWTFKKKAILDERPLYYFYFFASVLAILFALGLPLAERFTPGTTKGAEVAIIGFGFTASVLFLGYGVAFVLQRLFQGLPRKERRGPSFLELLWQWLIALKRKICPIIVLPEQAGS